MNSRLKKKATSGVKWSAVSSFSLALTGVLRISILTRFLDKSDFGLMALVSLVIGYTAMFSDMGVSSAILHKQNITNKQQSSLFWLNIAIAILLFLILLLVAPFVSDFYQEPELLILIPLMSLGIILNSFGRQFKVMLQKNLLFRYLALLDISSSVFTIIIAAVLAYLNYGVYALVYSALFNFTYTNLILLVYGLINFKISIHFNYKEIKSFLKIGIYQVGGQTINYFNKSLDILIFGKFFGSEVLGVYSLSKSLVNRPMQLIGPIITRVATPVLATMQLDSEKLKNNYLKLVKIVSSIYTPIYLLIIIFAPLIVRILYGEGYESTITIVRILSVYMIIRSILSTSGSLIIALGRTDLDFKWNLFTLFISPIVILIGAQISVQVAVILLTLNMILFIYPGWKMLISKSINITFKQFLYAMKPDFIIILKMIKNRNGG